MLECSDIARSVARTSQVLKVVRNVGQIHSNANQPGCPHQMKIERLWIKQSGFECEIPCCAAIRAWRGTIRHVHVIASSHEILGPAVRGQVIVFPSANIVEDVVNNACSRYILEDNSLLVYVIHCIVEEP